MYHQRLQVTKRFLHLRASCILKQVEERKDEHPENIRFAF